MDGYLAKRQARKMLKASEFSAEDIVVDVGSGLGGFLVELSKQINFKNELTGIDLSEEMFKYAQGRLSKEGIKNIRLIQASALDFEKVIAGEVTVVTCNWVVKYLDDNELDLFFRQVFAALKPGGKFFISEFAPKYANRAYAKVMHARKFRSRQEVKAVLQKTGFIGIEDNSYSTFWFPITIVSITAIR